MSITLDCYRLNKYVLIIYGILQFMLWHSLVEEQSCVPLNIWGFAWLSIVIFSVIIAILDASHIPSIQTTRNNQVTFILMCGFGLLEFMCFCVAFAVYLGRTILITCGHWQNPLFLVGMLCLVGSFFLICETVFYYRIWKEKSHYADLDEDCLSPDFTSSIEPATGDS